MQNNYQGMTVNERLYESGRLEEFDKAIEAKNESQVRTILKDLEIDQPSIDSTTNRGRTHRSSGNAL